MEIGLVGLGVVIVIGLVAIIALQLRKPTSPPVD
jgi:hypothetical protein